MELVTASLLAMAIGLTVGLKIKRSQKNQTQLVSKDEKSKMKTLEPVAERQGMGIHFDTLEFRFLKRLIDSEENGVSVIETNEILRIEKLSKENQRQRRHLFLKELNLKLKIIFNVKESIERQPTELDRRSKFYQLHHNIYKRQLEELVENKG